LKKTYRVIDANINRISEGLRVLEDIARFVFDDSDITENLKNIRHIVRKTVKDLQPQLIGHRNSSNDTGLDISKKTDLDDKKQLKDLVSANFKRVQEGLRVIEETLKIEDHYDMSKVYEICRFNIYSEEKTYFTLLNKITRRKLPDTELYCITDNGLSNGRSNSEVVSELIKAGVKIIQYREKEKPVQEMLAECRYIRQKTQESGVFFIVNDHVDLAIAVRADGVHIGQDDMPIEEVRKLVGDEMTIGLSTESPEQAEDAFNRGADYIGAGPVFKTDTKKDTCKPVGLNYLEYVAGNIDIPFVAIGGIGEDNVSEVISHGTKYVAMISDIVGAKNIIKKIENIRKKIKKAKG